jgi:nitrogen-specific signal transduction histidine kinase
LSKSIIESHGGYLTYRIINKKTTFSICLLDE